MVTEVEAADDARVAHLAGGARLVEEARHDVGPARQLGAQHLDGGPASQERVLAEVHHAHATLAEHLQQPIITQGPTDHVGRV